MSTIAENLNRLRSQLGSAQLLVVSKTQPLSLILEAHRAGQVHFGENKVQELLEKATQAPPEIKWHFIGHLQSNKLNQLLKVPGLVSIHSIDSIGLLHKLLARSCDTKIGVFLQVNTSLEQEKSGFESLEDLEQAVELLQGAQGFYLQGLMTIGAIRTEAFAEEARRCFQQLVDLRSKLEKKYGSSLELSMGMSSDYEIAVELGSDWIRIGTAIFGPRNQ